MESSPVIVDNPPFQGFPFDDDITPGKSKLKEHLDDLAQRHPEFAEQLKGWGDIEKRPRHEVPSTEEGVKPQKDKEEGASMQEDEICPKGKLRNTVPDMQQSQVTQDEVDRAHRSQSAPPDTLQRQQQQQHHCSSRQEIPHNTEQHNQSGPSPREVHPQQCFTNYPPNHHQSSGIGSRAPNVRHIPIHVEGRDEPLLPREVTDPCSTNMPPYQQPLRPARKQPPKSNEGHMSQSSQLPPQPVPMSQPHVHQQYTQQPQPHQQYTQHQHPPHQPTGGGSAHHHQQTSNRSPSPPSPPLQAHPPPPPPPRIDPLDQVAAVQKEVDLLKGRVETLTSAAKDNREYIYLDEMLTRHLLKLDNINIEGREEVRAARKEVIKRIQECINFLESLPNTENPKQSGT